MCQCAQSGRPTVERPWVRLRIRRQFLNGSKYPPAEPGDIYTDDSQWRNRAEFFSGRDAIRAFLERKWARELEYRLIKEVWAFHDARIAVRFVYEWHDDSGQWYRSFGNEQWEFAPSGLMRRRQASINDLPIAEAGRRFLWPAGARPTDHPGLSELVL